MRSRSGCRENNGNARGSAALADEFPTRVRSGPTTLRRLPHWPRCPDGSGNNSKVTKSQFWHLVSRGLEHRPRISLKNDVKPAVRRRVCKIGDAIRVAHITQENIGGVMRTLVSIPVSIPAALLALSIAVPLYAQQTRPDKDVGKDLAKENRELKEYIERLEKRLAELQAKSGRIQPFALPRPNLEPYKPVRPAPRVLPYGYQLVPPPTQPAPQPRIVPAPTPAPQQPALPVA